MSLLLRTCVRVNVGVVRANVILNVSSNLMASCGGGALQSRPRVTNPKDVRPLRTARTEGVWRRIKARNRRSWSRGCRSLGKEKSEDIDGIRQIYAP